MCLCRMRTRDLSFTKNCNPRKFNFVSKYFTLISRAGRVKRKNAKKGTGGGDEEEED